MTFRAAADSILALQTASASAAKAADLQTSYGPTFNQVHSTAFEHYIRSIFNQRHGILTFKTSVKSLHS
jgi:hypothetical protein